MAFIWVKVHKSFGPVGVYSIFSIMFRRIMIHFKSLQAQQVLKVWEDAVVVPFSKSSRLKTLNDFRQATLTSIVMKTFERLVGSEIPRKTECPWSPAVCLQPLRAVEDAKVTRLNLHFKHLKGKECHARLLFIDFFICFSTSYVKQEAFWTIWPK